MQDKLSLDTLDQIKLPALDDSSEEETLYEAKEPKIHNEHKLLEAHEAVLAEAKQKIRKLEIENNDLALLGPHRRNYSWWILGFVILFVIISFSVLLMSSYQIEVVGEGEVVDFRTLIELDNEVLMTLLATNTVQVVGLLYVVAKWLFPTKSKGQITPGN